MNGVKMLTLEGKVQLQVLNVNRRAVRDGDKLTFKKSRSFIIWADLASPRSTVVHRSPPSELARTLITRGWSDVGLCGRFSERG